MTTRSLATPARRETWSSPPTCSNSAGTKSISAVGATKILGLALLALASTALGGVDLTPSVTKVDEDGVQFEQLRFRSDGGSVFLVPPEKWTFSGGAGRLQFKAPGKEHFEAFIEAAPSEGQMPIDDAVRAQFKQQVMATLPHGSQKVETLTEADNTLMPGGNPSFEVFLSYVLWGKNFQRSALLVHTPRERLVFRLTALEADFPALMNQFRRSMMSWQYTEPKAPEGASPAPAAAAPQG